LDAPLRKQSQCFAGAGPSIKQTFAALFIGKYSPRTCMMVLFYAIFATQGN
jgi:hypothetical protein